MASIEKRPPRRHDGATPRSGERWRARFRDRAGKEHARHFRTRADAQAWLDEQTASLVTGTYADPSRGRQSFHDFAVEWAEGQDWKITTRESFPSVLARIEGALPKGAQLSDIDQLVIKKARVTLGRQYEAAATVRLTMTYLLGIMRDAHIGRRIGNDPTIGARPRRGKAAPRVVSAEDVPTRDEVLTIWNAAPPPYRAAIALGSTGLRIGEVLGLTADRIDLERRRVIIDRQLQRIEGKMRLTTVKGEKPRTITVSTPVAFELRRHLREYGDEGFLFRGVRTGAEMRRDQFYGCAWHPALIGAGLESDRFVFHSLRHFCASSLLAEGTNPVAVAGHLGDAVETLQRVYAHWLRDDADVPADALDRVFQASAEHFADHPRTEGLSGA